MYGGISSLVDRSIQLMKRVRMEPEFTLTGGILRFRTMAEVIPEGNDQPRAVASDPA